MKPWDYRKSRGEVARAKKKGIKDFAPSTPVTEDQLLVARRKDEKIAAGMVPVVIGSGVCSTARQLALLEEDPTPVDGVWYPATNWVPVWFWAVYELSPAPRSVLGIVSEELRRSTERVRVSSRERILTVSEFLLCFPHCGNDIRRAALAYLECVRR